MIISFNPLRKIFLVVGLQFVFFSGMALGESFPASVSRGIASAAPALSASATAARNASDNLLFFPGEVATSPLFLVPDPFSTTVRIITSLAVVISLLFGISWFIQRRGGFNRSLFGRILGIVPLDGKRFIYLVDVLGRVLVLGVTEQNINLLCEINDKTTIDALRLQGNAPTMPGLEKIFPFLQKNRGDSEDPLSGPDLESRARTTDQQKRQVEKLIIRRDTPGPDNRRP